MGKDRLHFRVQSEAVIGAIGKSSKEKKAMTDGLTLRVQTLEKKIVDAINSANLPPIIVDLLLNSLLAEVKEAEQSYNPQIKEINLNDEVPSDRDSDKQ